jgi:hypothetical protein
MNPALPAAVLTPEPRNLTQKNTLPNTRLRRRSRYVAAKAHNPIPILI